MSRPLRILVTGSRDWADECVISEALSGALAEYATIGLPVLVHGGCPRGADLIAEKIWREWMLRLGGLGPSEVHFADWRKHGRAAGPIRNGEMVAAGATVCLAFPLGESPGTRNCMSLAEAAGIPVHNFGDLA